MKVLVTGSTGYIGGRLVPELIQKKADVRILVRDERRTRARAWSRFVEIVEGDLGDAACVEKALRGVDVAYYLVHSMYRGRGFEELDRRLARSFAGAARDTKHVIYLGGLLPRGEGVSRHLRSRAEVGAILRERCRVTEFRAGPVVGSGSTSFEMVRYLTERLPLMVTPRWIFTPVQTIAIRDILSYLIQALPRDPLGIVEVGSPAVTFREMMLTYARVRGLRRVLVPTPLLAPGLASHWVGLVTPIPNAIARPLIRGVTRPVLADTRRASSLFPEIRPASYEASVRAALREFDRHEVESRCGDAVVSGKGAVVDREGRIEVIRAEDSTADARSVFDVFTRLGGENGWLVWEWAWRVRGFLDRIAGGPGMRRGRRHPESLRAGDAVDFWRVESINRNRFLRLRAEMRLPGRAWLEWEVLPGAEGSRLVQTARFAPRGLGGVLYWYLLYPLHKMIFRDLARAIVAMAEEGTRTVA